MLAGLGHVPCEGYSSMVVFMMWVPVLWAGPRFPHHTRASCSHCSGGGRPEACSIPPAPAASARTWWGAGTVA